MELQQNTEKEEENNVAKRAAFAGQWRTPPLPVFPTNSNTSATETTTTESLTAAVAVTTQQPAQMLPSSTEDYVKALQEAYLRGAEAAAALAQQQQQQQQHQQTINTTTSCPEFATQSSSVVPLYPTATPMVTTSTNPTTMPPPRSLSLMEMYPSPAEPPQPPQTHDEELKRQKRLARNRASARLRRLRKKNLVDAYEAEVKALERILHKLQEHVWGHPESDGALLEALSMERGQQELSGKQRHQAAIEIVQQQVEFLQMLQEIMQEQYILYQVAAPTQNEWQELSQLLQLSAEQKEALQAQATGWHEEYQALQTVVESLQAMQDNHWLWNNGVAEIAEQFMQILHKNQVSKFLSWADHNWDALDELDFTSAPSKMGPVFQFGVDSMPTDEK
ncbi:hypothetical protein FisN_27Lh093 [Fistulifera solaris]|uniref:BZIP domain-containing protein n=1 Tax=Fistulifera solaris TaxID=1519565 RepID=A0A1Z5KAM9_FISSO|nr:hypothetical protein FisN_27Lh093 [Fistulifera solaris]|eukprot:GAX23319.1 hypothetical protein FisN_27Lh093 [Fistulifera solaris]